MDNFEKILKIAKLQVGSKILDIGAGGLDGENTSEYLYKLYNNSCTIYANHTGVSRSTNWCKNKNVIEIIGDCHLDGIYDEFKPFDLIIQDLPLIPNLDDWENLDFINKYIHSLLTPTGWYITYVMTNGRYGTREHQQRLSVNFKDYWKTNSQPPTNIEISKKLEENYGNLFSWIVVLEEGRRNIVWVLIRKK